MIGYCYEVTDVEYGAEMVPPPRRLGMRENLSGWHIVDQKFSNRGVVVVWRTEVEVTAP